MYMYMYMYMYNIYGTAMSRVHTSFAILQMGN